MVRNIVQPYPWRPKPTNRREPKASYPKVDVLLVTVTDTETQAVYSFLEQTHGRQPVRYFGARQIYYDLGMFGGARTYMVCSWMGSTGPGGSSQTIAEAITELSPSAIIMVGIAFGINPDKQEIGGILISKQLHPYELQRIGTARKWRCISKLERIPRGDRPSAPIHILNLFRDARLDWKVAPIQFGLVLSGDKLVDNIDFRNQLLEIEPEAIGGEMEGAGLYDAACRYQVDWLVVKAICDWADGKKREKKQERQELAARNAIAFTIHALEQGGFASPGPQETWGQDYADALKETPGVLPWLHLWPKPGPEDPAPIANWLQTVGLQFNPFGPESAELDPRLPTYGVTAILEQIRGRRSMLVFGEPGYGKTSAARLHALQCVIPPDRPREKGVLPVYYVPPVGGPESTSQHAHLQAIAQVTAQVIAQYIAHREEGFLSLSPLRQDSIARLLSLWARSPRDLAACLRRAGPARGTSPELMRAVLAQYQPIAAADMSEGDLWDLLEEATPAGIECMYLLADLPDQRRQSLTANLVPLACCLLDMTVSLTSRGIYLKLFVSDQVHAELGDSVDCEEMTLSWTPALLKNALDSRFRMAGGDCLAALCIPPDPILDDLLVMVAKSSPRRLVRAGNALLREHVRESEEAPIAAEWALRFLQDWGARNA